MYFLLCLFFHTIASATTIDFKADYYERSLETDTVRGKGHAWIHTEDREVWADEIEIDYKLNRALAVGHVRVKDLDSDITAVRVSYSLDGTETILDSAVIVSRQMVLTGTTVTKRGKENYDIEDGSYTNCNLENLPPEQAGSCKYHWRIFGRRFSVQVGHYAHISDALILVENLPIAYSPYLIVPVKSDRESGLLLPSFINHVTKGTGISLPYYWAMAAWQDLEINPTYYFGTGYDLGLNYRYSYDRDSRGLAEFHILQRQFGDLPLRSSDRVPADRTLGVIGEWSLFTHLQGELSERNRFIAAIRRVSNPIYTVDYLPNINVSGDLASLRSQATYSHSTDDVFFGAGIIDHQSLIVSRDQGVDRGAVAQLPLLLYSRPSKSFLGNLLSIEVDAEWANFSRPGLGYDGVPATVATSGDNTDPNPSWHPGDYIRTGQRLIAEPRLVANVPMPPGFQFQPVLSGGSLGYYFNIPTTQTVFRFYSNVELPLSLYLSKVFHDDDGTPLLSHVIQPRVVYAKNLFHSPTPAGGFFQALAAPDPSSTGFRAPLFDSRDLLSPFEYIRFELINRFRHRTGPGRSSRVFALQVSEQFNIKSSSTGEEADRKELANDPRYAQGLGPVDVLAAFSLGRFSGQVQASYQLTPKVFNESEYHENDWSSGLDYKTPAGDFLSLSNRFQNRADSTQTDQTARFAFFKGFSVLPDLGGNMEYSVIKGTLVRYALSATFSQKPVSCWSITARVGEDNMATPSLRTFSYTLSFRLDFGSPGRMFRET